MKILLFISLFVAGLTVRALAANPAVVTPDGRRMEGTEVRASREGVIFLTTASGRLEYPKGTKVVMDQPADLIKAEEQVQKKLYADVIPVLEKLADDLRFLGWDVKARKLLALAYAGKGEAQKAVSAYESLLVEFKDLGNDEGVRAGYLRALAAAGDMEKVTPLLDKAIRTGTRGEAAQAQLLRGKARLAGGDIEGALFDFMRNARFFKEFKEEAAESAFLTAECLEKLNEGEKAVPFYRQVAQEFPESRFSAQAKAKAGNP